MVNLREILLTMVIGLGVVGLVLIVPFFTLLIPFVLLAAFVTGAILIKVFKIKVN